MPWSSRSTGAAERRTADCSGSRSERGSILVLVLLLMGVVVALAVYGLRMAQVDVQDVAGNPGWYSVGLKARPHFKYMGASFTLSLVGKLDKK